MTRSTNGIFAASWRAALCVILVTSGLGTGGCNKETATSENATTAPATGAVITEAAWTPDALEELVAPIALYPDPLVAQILAASVNSQEVLDAGNWLLENQDLQGDALDKASEKAGFGPAMRALVHFPTVVDMMCQELDWTKQLGSAFTSDQKAVLDAIQRLRASAAAVGNLKSGKEQTVETKTENGQPVIVVQPADPKVIYVPQYNPQTVYTTAPATTAASEETVSKSDAVGGALLAFGVGMLVGAAVSNSYCYPSWGYGAVYYGPRPFYPPAYAYRPVYPGYHPAYRYAPPGGYRYGYNNRTNVIINNNDYYNRFDGNRNMKNNGSRSPISGNRNDNRVGDSRPQAKNTMGQSWKGQSSYAGKSRGSSAQTRPAQANSNRPTAGNRAANVDRGYGGSDRPVNRGTNSYAGARGGASASTGRVSQGAAQTGGARVIKGGHDVTSGAGAADAGGSRLSTSPSAANVIRPSSRDNAFSGASQAGGGSFDRAASARGHASAGASSGSGRSSSGGSTRSGGGGGRRR